MSEKMFEDIIKESKKGNIIIAGLEGLSIIKLDEIIEQPVEGLLYDLNRDEATIRTFIKKGDPKWVNDYASIQVIIALKNKLDALENLVG